MREDKTLQDYLYDWYSDAFGFGYGTGDEFFCRDLLGFFMSLNRKDYGQLTYSYEVLEDTLGKSSAWYIINELCKSDCIEYGTSPRFGWLTERGKLMNEAIGVFNHDSLYEFMTGNDEPYNSCMKSYCNHSDLNEKGCLTNPFWFNQPKK